MKIPKSFLGRTFALVAIVVLIVCPSWAATQYQKLYSFTGASDGGDPSSPLTFDSAGNAYGTTAAGGDFGLGTVFQLTPSGQQIVLHSFAGGYDGSDPHGGVTLDSSGTLYGTTVAGGIGGICAGDGCGTVFTLSPSQGGAWTETVIYNFRGGNDGFGAGSAVVFDQAGNLFGTTPDGGMFSAGTIYKLSRGPNGQWRERVIHNFTGGKDGAVGSLGPLLLDASGNLYGIAELGGAFGFGTVYKLTREPAGWRFTTLYAFKGMPDAAFPFGGLIFDAAGNLYGATYFGGQTGMGAVFQLALGPNGAWQENVLYSFLGGTDGGLPTTTLVFDAKANLYGSTSTGGRPTCDCGTLFKLTLSGGSWIEKVIHRFGRGRDGSSPIYGLTFDQSGHLFGTTPVGGLHGQGSIFELTP